MQFFDLHCDTLYEIAKDGHSLSKNNLHVDLERGLEFECWAQAFAVWMPDSIRGEEAKQQCLRIIKMAHMEADRNSKFHIIKNKNDFDIAFQNRTCAAILAVEGGSALAGSLETLETLKELDVKIITLTWNGSNELGHGCLSDCDEGLTDFGKNAVNKMEALDIIPDVSHLNQAGFWDVMDIASGPVIASHSVSAAIWNHKRNLTDSQFEAIRDRCGLVGLNLCGEHLGKQDFETFERHLYHFLSLGGEKTLGFGCDFDGTELPAEWGGIQVMHRLYEYLQSKNYDNYLLYRIFFGNCYDFFLSFL
ncbi:MAG TPA: membrane dipeptidase [Candidatus Avimonas sp.]|nr:hypothetical protein [Clostridiales bacterium]HPU58583.1 membrane dipeptidase [Candidatus Avimonas sp.]